MLNRNWTIIQTFEKLCKLIFEQKKLNNLYIFSYFVSLLLVFRVFNSIILEKLEHNNFNCFKILLILFNEWSRILWKENARVIQRYM